METETVFKVKDGLETLSYNEIRRIDRMIAYDFLVKTREKELLLPKEIEGIVYFIGVNLNKLASLIGVDRSTLTNVIKTRLSEMVLIYQTFFTPLFSYWN